VPQSIYLQSLVMKKAHTREIIINYLLTIVNIYFVIIASQPSKCHALGLTVMACLLNGQSTVSLYVQSWSAMPGTSLPHTHDHFDLPHPSSRHTSPQIQTGDHESCPRVYNSLRNNINTLVILSFSCFSPNSELTSLFHLSITDG